MTGSMTFGQPAGDSGQRGAGNGLREGGISVDRFAELQEAAPRLINTSPAISVFFKPRMSGKRYLKELGDRAIITWSLTEPVGNIQDMTWTPTVNRFQAVLRKDGTIELSYDDVAAKDAIVGVFPMVTRGVEKEIANIAGAEPSPERAAAGSNPAIKSLKLAAVDGLLLKATLRCAGRCGPKAIPGWQGSDIGFAWIKRGRLETVRRQLMRASSGRSWGGVADATVAVARDMLHSERAFCRK
jgi:hypothetical protein